MSQPIYVIWDGLPVLLLCAAWIISGLWMPILIDAIVARCRRHYYVNIGTIETPVWRCQICGHRK